MGVFIWQAFNDGFYSLLQKLNDSIQAIPLLGNDPVFHPFTRPILYGKLVEVRLGGHSLEYTADPILKAVFGFGLLTLLYALASKEPSLIIPP